MNKYKNGKIYKITDVGYQKCYIGSTCESLSQRLTRHRASYKQHLKGNYNRCKCYDLFEEFGAYNVKIELVEYYSCNDKNELLKREGYHIRNNECVNKYIPDRSKQDYHEEFKDYLSEKKKEYYHKHKAYFYKLKRDKINNEKEEHLEKQREYYRINKEKFINVDVKLLSVVVVHQLHDNTKKDMNNLRNTNTSLLINKKQLMPVHQFRMSFNYIPFV